MRRWNRGTRPHCRRAIATKRSCRVPQALRVPVINQERFLHLIGYRSLAEKSTPF